MKRAFACIVAVVMAACSHSSGSSGTSGSASNAQGTPGAVATNSTDFPLYNGSVIVSSHDWTQAITPAAASADKGVFAQGAGTYSGHEVIAHTPATIQQLRQWLDAMEKNPPAGYQTAVTGSGVNEARNRAQAAGIDFDAFEKEISGKKHGIVVLAIDPSLLQSKAGPMLGFISKYKMLPQGLRDPIDAQAKARTGFSITEALSPDTPLGAALGALDEIRSSGDRGVVLIDATKQ